MRFVRWLLAPTREEARACPSDDPTGTHLQPPRGKHRNAAAVDAFPWRQIGARVLPRLLQSNRNARSSVLVLLVVLFWPDRRQRLVRVARVVADPAPSRCRRVAGNSQSRPRRGAFCFRVAVDTATPTIAAPRARAAAVGPRNPEAACRGGGQGSGAGERLRQRVVYAGGNERGQPRRGRRGRGW